MENNKVYDLIVLGAGPAGLSAALYAGRANLDVLVIEKPNIGSLLMAHKIENYPGAEMNPTGKELYNIMKNQTLNFNVQYKDATFLGFDMFNQSGNKVVKTDTENFHGKSVVIATGWSKNSSKKITGEEKYLGAGVSYCATCDGAFTSGMEVTLVGKGEELAEEALFLTRYAKKINVFVTSDKLECDEEVFNSLISNVKVNITYSSEIIEIKGSDFVEKVILKYNGEIHEIDSQFVFLYLGTKSPNELYTEVARVNNDGYIETDDHMNTLVEGIYAAGDIRAKVVRQVTTATNDGTIAGMEAIKYILKNKKK